MVQYANSRPSARKVQRVENRRLITVYRARLAQMDVRVSGQIDFPTRKAAIEAAQWMKTKLGRVIGLDR